MAFVPGMVGLRPERLVPPYGSVPTLRGLFPSFGLVMHIREAPGVPGSVLWSW